MAAAAHDDHPFVYSDKYADGKFEYRHVTVPRDMVGDVPKGRIMKETEWRKLGIIQSCGWEHYAIHKPEPHILLFRRALGTDPTTGRVDARLARAAVEKYRREYEV